MKNFETIVSEIDQKIENAKQIIMLKYKQENQIELGRGGRITQAKENMPKFAKIGITDKYEIEAILDIGLAGVKFTKEGVQDSIKSAYTQLANSVNQYVISEVSKAIVNVIENERNVQLEQGASIELVEQYDELIESESAHLEYLNKFAETQKSTLAEWVNYLNQSEYPYAFRYLILRSVLLDNYDFKNDQLVKRNKKTIRNFTPFDAGTLAELFTNQSDYLLKDFSILQLENIERIVKAKEIAKASGGGTWLKFNGGSSTPEAERRANATELMQLVQDTYWCTKTNASGQLDGGDFYVYVTESEGKKFPRIAIRMDENKVGEVRGNASASQDLEPEMIPIAESFLENNFQDESGKKWLESVRYNKRAYNLYLRVLEEGVFEGFVEEFIDLKKDEKRFTLDYADRNGHIQRSENYLNENKDELRAVYGGRVAFNINEFNPKTTEIIIGDAYFRNSQVQDLGNLQTIGGTADFKNSQVQDLGNLQTIGGTADFRESQIQSLGNLQTIGGSAYFGESQVQSLGNLQTIMGLADFRNSQVRDLGNLQTIGGSADFRYSQVQDLGNLQTIGSYAEFRESQVQSLGNLQTIGGSAYFRDSQVESLGNLQTIGGVAEFRGSEVQSLGNLQTIGGDALFGNSQVKSLGNLQTIGYAFFGNRTDLEAEWEQKQKALEMGRGGNVSPSKTPAPFKERIYGSKINKPESSASLRSASTIKLSPENISTLNKKVLEFKSKYVNRNKKMTLNAVKAVMRRGMGAYSSTHRPTISGGKPNSRVAWGLARVNAFLYKAEKGIPKNPKYVQDDDLLRELGYKIKMYYGGLIYEPQLNEFDELELAKGGEISSEKFIMPSKEILEYGQFLKDKHPEVWKAGGNIFGNQAFENLKKVSKRGYWLESERWMYEKWQSFVKRHQHNHLLAGVIANVKWASWGNIGKSEAKSVIENAFSKN